MGEQLTHGRDGAGHEGSEPPPAHKKTKKRDMTQTKHELHCMAEYKHNRDVVWNFGVNARAFYDAQNETLEMHYPNGEVTVVDIHNYSIDDMLEEVANFESQIGYEYRDDTDDAFAEA